MNKEGHQSQQNFLSEKSESANDVGDGYEVKFKNRSCMIQSGVMDWIF